MKSARTLLSAVALSAVALCFVMVNVTSADLCHIRFQPTFLTLEQIGTVDTVAIVATDSMTSLSLYELDITYNAATLHVVNVLQGPSMEQSSHSDTWFAWQFWPDPLIENGCIKVLESVLNPDSCGHGPGTLFSVVFETTQCGTTQFLIDSATARTLGCSRQDTTAFLSACTCTTSIFQDVVVPNFTVYRVGDSLRFRWQAITGTANCPATVLSYEIFSFSDLSLIPDEGEIIATVDSSQRNVSILLPADLKSFYVVRAHYIH